MGFKPPIAVYDACVLYPFHLRNVLVQCAADRLVDARWTDLIHDEWIRNLSEGRRGDKLPPDRARLLRTRDLMNAALPDANVTGFERHIDGVDLPDPDDRHVVAAAIESGATIIVTANVKDFPAEALSRHGVRRQTPDAFILDIYQAAPGSLVDSIERSRLHLSKGRLAPADYLESLRRQGLDGLVERVSKRFGQE